MSTKREERDIVAFVANLSPTKQNSARVSLQVGSESIKKGIIFDLSKLPVFKEKLQSGEPLKILNCVIDKVQNPNYAEVIINDSSKVVNPQPGDVSFERKEPKLVILKVKDLDKRMTNQLVSVAGKVVPCPSKFRIVESFGKQKKLTDQNLFADDTGSISLTLWEEWINYFDDNGDYFKLFNVVVKFYNDQLYLSTCSQSFAEVYEDCVEVAIPGSDVDVNIVKILEFDSVGKFQYYLNCCKCNKQIVPTSGTIAKCNNCGFSMKTSKLSKSLIIPVSCIAEFTGQFFIDFNDLAAYTQAFDSSDNVFTVDEDKVVNFILNVTSQYFECNARKRTLKFCDRPLLSLPGQDKQQFSDHSLLSLPEQDNQQ